MLAIATSDHQVSLARSSHGKSNSVANIMLVSSIETRSTQSKISLRGSASSTSEVRWRISDSRLMRFEGATIGATVRRCALMWGVDALLTEEIDDVDRMSAIVDAIVSEHGYAAPGDTIVIAAGLPLAQHGVTNFVHLHNIEGEPE